MIHQAVLNVSQHFPTFKSRDRLWAICFWNPEVFRCWFCAAGEVSML